MNLSRGGRSHDTGKAVMGDAVVGITRWEEVVTVGDSVSRSNNKGSGGVVNGEKGKWCDWLGR